MFSIIGNGHWGTALAYYLSQQYPVELIGRRCKESLYNQVDIPQKTSWEQASYDHLIYAGPTIAAKSILKPILSGDYKPSSCIIASKGLIEDEQGLIITLPDFASNYLKRVALISGPSFANELLDNKPTFLMGATTDATLANDLDTWFNHEPIHFSQSDDCLGVAFTGAFKNPIAILIGYVDALLMSANMRFALITSVNQVLANLLLKIGANPSTAYSIAGQGDLFMTCSIDISRNRQMGQLLAQGYSVDVAQTKIGSIVEGIASLKHLLAYCKQKKIHVPLFEFINDLIAGKIEKKVVFERLIALIENPAIKNLQNLDV